MRRRLEARDGAAQAGERDYKINATPSLVINGKRHTGSVAFEELDKVLRGAERALTRREGLPGRPWYRHQIYAPGRYTGYGVKTLPAVREAIELRNWNEADEQIAIVGRTLDAFATEVQRAARLLETP